MRGDVGDERKLTTAVDEPDLLHGHDDSIERLSVLVQHTSDNRAVAPQNEIDALADVARFHGDRFTRLRSATFAVLSRRVPGLAGGHPKRQWPRARDLVATVLVCRRIAHRGGWTRHHQEPNARAGDRPAVRSHNAAANRRRGRRLRRALGDQ